MNEGKVEFYQERAILALKRGDYGNASIYAKKAEELGKTKRPTDKYAVGSIIRFSHTWRADRDFYIVGVKIEDAPSGWLVYSRNSSYQTNRNTFLTWEDMLNMYWNESHSVHVFNEANGKVLK